MSDTHTLAEIDETIGLMEARLESGQGRASDAMCRLGLTITRALRAALAVESDHANYLRFELGLAQALAQVAGAVVQTCNEAEVCPLCGSDALVGDGEHDPEGECQRLWDALDAFCNADKIYAAGEELADKEQKP